jgi:hypothetical protein
LRERRVSSLIQIQDAAVEVESNVLAVDTLINKVDTDRRKGRFEASTSDPFAPHPQVNKLTKMVKSLSAEMDKMKFEGKQSYKNSQNDDNRGNFIRPKFSPQILPREPKNRDRDDQRIHTPL